LIKSLNEGGNKTEKFGSKKSESRKSLNPQRCRKKGDFYPNKTLRKNASCEKSEKIKIAESSIFGTNILGVVPVVLKSQSVRHKLVIPYLKNNYQYCSHSQLPLFSTKSCTMEAKAKVKPHKARRSGGRGRAAPPVRCQQNLSCQAFGRAHSGPLVILSTRNGPILENFMITNRECNATANYNTHPSPPGSWQQTPGENSVMGYERRCKKPPIFPYKQIPTSMGLKDEREDTSIFFHF